MASDLHKSLISGVAWTSVSTWINKAIGIVYTIAILSYLSVYDYGVTELILSVPALLGFMNLPGLDTAVMADMATEHSKHNNEKAKFIFTSYVSLRLVLGSVAWALLFFSAPLVESAYNSAMATMVQVLSFTFLFSPIRTAYQILFRVSLKFDVLALHRILEEITKLVVVLVAFYVLDLGMLGVVIAYISTDIVALPVFSVLFVRSWRHYYSDCRTNDGWLQPFHTLQAHGKWGIFSTYINQFGQNIRPWIIKVTLGTHAVGLYAAAMGMYQNTASLIPVSQVAAPVIPQFLSRPKALCSLSNTVLKYQFLAYVMSGLAMLLFLPVLIMYFFPEFSASYSLYAVLLLALIPTAFSSIFETIFVAFKAQKNLFFANIAILISVVLILPVSVYFFGLFGIALEFFITRLIYALGRFNKLKELVPEYRLELSQLYRITETDRLIFKTLRTPFMKHK